MGAMHAQAHALRLLHVDAQVIVVDKPGGLLSVPGRGEDKQDCVIHRVQRDYPDALIVHRLDMATSGLLLLARGPAMQRALSEDFALRRVSKRYQALVEGALTPAVTDAEGWAEVDLPLITDWPNRPRQKIDFETGKPALTRYRVLASEGPHTRVELAPVTGRTHQLRMHMLALGHAIVGDALYAAAEPNALASRLMLHACHLALPHRGLRFDCPAEF
jgi:tRNA pseudouridine32 synthase/23S rRNA pseudouridine746 synthase